MTLSIWRYAHLALALISSLFLVMASVTGVILAVDAVQEKIPSYRVANFNVLTVAEVLPTLKGKYGELAEISVDHNGFVLLKGFDNAGNEVDAYIDPNTGSVLGKPVDKSEFVQWNIALHRSLFLKETGRLIIGVISFLLIVIAVSGLVLVIKRQSGLKRFFAKVVKEYFAQYYHVVTGRLMLIPILIIAVTGTYLSMARFHIFPVATSQHQKKSATADVEKQQDIANFAIFKSVKMADVKKIEFPFAEDPEEFYTLKLNDSEVLVNQFSGAVISEIKYPKTLLLENLSLNLHTGRTNIIWAIILGIAAINILFFIYSGFVISLKRRATKIRNKFNPSEAEYILLVGSENGNTLYFANAIHQALLQQGKLSYISQLNQYQAYPKAKHLIVFTSTYGLGEAPINANKALVLIQKIPQSQQVNFSVIGFGSRAYPDFCAFATRIDQILAKQTWAVRATSLHTVDDKSPSDFVKWTKQWSLNSGLPLATTPALYAQKATGLEKMMVVNRTEVSASEQTFMVTIHSPARTKFTSGDLLAIYPENDHRERLYSIAKINENIQLVIKFHPKGIGSEYLNKLKVGSTFKGRIVQNSTFHAPKDKSIIMIGNGTGVAPFLGMVEQHMSKKGIALYLGFGKQTEVVKQHEIFLTQQIKKKQLKSYQIALSREQNQCYVMDLIRKDASAIAQQLNEGTVIMICGSLQMQLDVEEALNDFCASMNGKTLIYYKDRGQILTDCY